jgi:hypothetical protein
MVTMCWPSHAIARVHTETRFAWEYAPSWFRANRLRGGEDREPFPRKQVASHDSVDGPIGLTVAHPGCVNRHRTAHFNQSPLLVLMMILLAPSPAAAQ